MKYVQNSELMCRVHSMTYDFTRKTGVLRMAEGNCCDMQGCIDLFTRVAPDVQKIETYAGDVPDTFYKKNKLGWVAA